MFAAVLCASHWHFLFLGIDLVCARDWGMFSCSRTEPNIEIFLCYLSSEGL